MNASQRIDLILSRESINQKQLAEALNTSDQTITNWKKRDSIGAKSARQISDKYGYRLEWLLSGEGEMLLSEPANIRETRLKAGVWEGMDHDKDEFVELPLLNVSLAAGDGSCEIEESTEFALIFRKHYLRRMGVPESAARVVRVIGQSMEPTLHDGDVVGVNMQETSIRDGKTYAICQADLLRVKTLIATPSNVIIRSINREEYPDEVMSRDDFNRNVRVIGKVFWSSHSW